MQLPVTRLANVMFMLLRDLRMMRNPSCSTELFGLV